LFVKINGKICYLSRAIDHEGRGPGGCSHGEVGQMRGDRTSREDYEEVRGFSQHRHRQASCVFAATKEIGAADWHEVGGWINNRAENSHQRRRERAMEQFLGLKMMQKIGLVHAQVFN
jgi:putative transposase